MCDETTLHIHILGPPTLQLGGELFSVSRLQNRALLFRLAAQSEPVSRDHLAFLFWPDLPDTQARRNLTQLLSHVRRTLPDPELLVSTKEHICLDTKRVWSDAVEFQRLCQHQDPPQIADLEQGLALYRDALLTGMSTPDNGEYENWMTAERVRLERLALNSMSTLAAYHSRTDQTQQALELCQRYLSIDPLAEEMHRSLIRLYTAAGDRQRARQQYEQCAAILQDELGVTPLPETEQALRLVETSEPTEPSDAVPEPNWMTLPGPTIPLMGRQTEMCQLEEALIQVQSGHGQIVFLSGDPGIGKSRVMQDFATQVSDRVLLVTGSCHLSTQSVPLQPIVEAFRPFVASQFIDRPGTLPWIKTLVPLFPELSTLYPDLSPVSTDAGVMNRKGQIFEALHQVLANLANPTTPILFCLDDLHWSDTMTLEWLGYLGRRIRSCRVLILSAFRSNEAENLAGLLREMGRQHVCRILSLTALTTENIQETLGVFAVENEPTVAVQLLNLTGGNPFYLLETIQSLREDANSGLTDLSQLSIPASVRESLDRRVTRLHPMGRQILETAAVLGSRVDFDLVRETSGRTELECADGLDELLHRAFLVETDNGLRFQHEITRTHVYDSLTSWRRRLLHRRAADALTQLFAVDQDDAAPSLIAQLGHHYDEAQEGERAVPYLLRAGDYARNLYDHQSALGLYGRALEILRQGDQAELTARTLMKVAQTHHTAYQFDSAQAVLEESMALQAAEAVGRAISLSAAPHALRVAWPAPPQILDPSRAEDYYSRSVLLHLFSGLVRLTPEQDIVPDVARRWEILDQGRTYVFHLRSDLVWSDGKPLTAHDFEFAWKRVLDPAIDSAAADLLYDLRNARAFHQGGETDSRTVGVSAEDDHTLVVHLDEPAAYFLHLVTHTACFPIPKHIVRRHGEDWTRSGAFACNGPFTLTSWERGMPLVLARNPLYHGEFPGNVTQVELHAPLDQRTALTQYTQDDLDLFNIIYPPVHELEQFRRRHEDEHLSVPILGTDFVGFNTAAPPFDRVEVRQAFSMATDREKLTQQVMQNYVTPAMGGFLPPGMPGHSPDIGLPFQPDRARALLVAAGLSDSLDMPLKGIAPKGMEPLCAFLQEAWQLHLGVSVQWQFMAWESFLDQVENQRPLFYFFTWQADYPDPDNFLRAGPVHRYSSWRDEVYSWLIQDARRTSDPQERMELCRQMDRMLMEEAIVLPLSYACDHFLAKPWIRRPSASAVNWWPWQEMVIDPH